jgi:hypothetical protein
MKAVAWIEIDWRGQGARRHRIGGCPHLPGSGGNGQDV